jgi:transcriptional regulator with XRE-family HTH domain
VRIGRLLLSWRHHEEMTIREAADRLGMPASTFARIEKGHAPDSRTLAMILRWVLEED